MRRFLAPVVIAVVVIGLAAALWSVFSARPAGSESGAGDPRATPPADAFEVTIDYVYDGDSLRTDAGEVRLIGIDAPEGTPTPECGADAARDRLRELLPEGDSAWAAYDAERTDRFDRALLYLWNDEGRFVNATMLAEGLAAPYDSTPNTTYAEQLQRAAASAPDIGC